MPMASIKKASDIFKSLVQNKEKFLVIGSRRLDFDCIGSGLIIKKYLEHLGKQATFVYPRKIDFEEKERYKFLPYFEEVIDEDTRTFLKGKKYDCLILVDGISLSQFYDTRLSSDNPPDFSSIPHQFRIDHHLESSATLDIDCICDIEASSTSSLIIEKIIPESFIDSKIATLALAGLVDDTGNFCWNFYAQSFKTAAALLEKGADALTIVDRINFYGDIKYFEMLAYAINNSLHDGKLATSFLFLPFEKIKKDKINSKKLDNVSEAFKEKLASRVKGYARGFMIDETIRGNISISARGNSLTNQINLPKLLTELGGKGGGHFNACGYEIKGDFDDIKDRLILLIKKHLSA